jgi:hypothetical protein
MPRRTVEPRSEVSFFLHHRSTPGRSPQRPEQVAWAHGGGAGPNLSGEVTPTLMQIPCPQSSRRSSE